MRRQRTKVGIIVMTTLVSFIGSALPAAAAPIGEEAFWRTWARTDKPIADGLVNRTWMWGPEAFTGVMEERYDDSPGAMRTVQYFDKSRMELTYPDIDPSDPFYVTNGLLAKELITGEMQVADDEWEDRAPAWVNVAGDPQDLDAPTYASLRALLDAPAGEVGGVITHEILRIGSQITESFGQYGVTNAVVVPETNHAVASPFWDFLHSNGHIYVDDGYQNGQLFDPWFYATGFPITEAYWARVDVNTVEQDVLIQCFERRCLTYTPSNDAAWQVEMGNVGQHYYRWRYEQWPGAVPAAGELIDATTPADWGNSTWPNGVVEVIDDLLQVTVLGPGEGNLHVVWTSHVGEPREYDDAVVSVDVRTTSTDPLAYGFGCVTARMTPVVTADGFPDEIYSLCLDSYGYVDAGYERFGEDGQFDRLLEGARIEYDPATASEWHRLSIVSRGETLWFLVDNNVVGTASHAGRLTGDAGFMTLNIGEGPVTWQYRNFEIRAIE